MSHQSNESKTNKKLPKTKTFEIFPKPKNYQKRNGNKTTVENNLKKSEFQVQTTVS